MGAGHVIRGPWPEHPPQPPAAADPPPRRITVRRVPRPPIPHHYRTRHGATHLMECKKCHRPFDPRLEVPRDFYCRECRSLYAEPALFDVEGEPTIDDPE